MSTNEVMDTTADEALLREFEEKSAEAADADEEFHDSVDSVMELDGAKADGSGEGKTGGPGEAKTGGSGEVKAGGSGVAMTGGSGEAMVAVGRSDEATASEAEGDEWQEASGPKRKKRADMTAEERKEDNERKKVSQKYIIFPGKSSPKLN